MKSRKEQQSKSDVALINHLYEKCPLVSSKIPGVSKAKEFKVKWDVSNQFVFCHVNCSQMDVNSIQAEIACSLDVAEDAFHYLKKTQNVSEFNDQPMHLSFSLNKSAVIKALGLEKKPKWSFFCCCKSADDKDDIELTRGEYKQLKS